MTLDPRTQELIDLLAFREFDRLIAEVGRLDAEGGEDYWDARAALLRLCSLNDAVAEEGRRLGVLDGRG